MSSTHGLPSFWEHQTRIRGHCQSPRWGTFQSTFVNESRGPYVRTGGVKHYFTILQDNTRGARSTQLRSALGRIELAGAAALVGCAIE
jgi:hypothetical protein